MDTHAVGKLNYQADLRTTEYLQTGSTDTNCRGRQGRGHREARGVFIIRGCKKERINDLTSFRQDAARTRAIDKH